MITPLNENLPVHTILGVLQSLRGILPHLDNNQSKHGIKGSFGAKMSPFNSRHGNDTKLDKKQYLQVKEIICDESHYYSLLKVMK